MSLVRSLKTGYQAHNCGFCGNGCRMGIKQGGVAYWLKDAVEHGAKVMDETDLLRIVHDGRGKARGVEIQINKNSQQKKLMIRAKKVVSCCGALHTPLLLKRSGFKNKHIGRGLKLHPVTVVFGEFPDVDINPTDKPIMTALCTELKNLDGRYHGPRIETLYHQPILENMFMPWLTGERFRQDMLRFNHLVPLLVLCRDDSSGTVTSYPGQPMLAKLDYVINKTDYKSFEEGSILSAKLLYIQGAKRIITSILTVPDFHSDKPVEERSVKDKDFINWINKIKSAQFGHGRLSVGSAHQLASCRMSNRGPSHSVCDTNGRLWECSNVYIADTSVLGSATGVNPMISCMATARVIAGYIIDHLTKL